MHSISCSLPNLHGTVGGKVYVMMKHVLSFLYDGLNFFTLFFPCFSSLLCFLIDQCSVSYVCNSDWYNSIALINSVCDLKTDKCYSHLKENLVKDFGEQHLNSEFLQLLLKKCFFNIFGSEHVSCILNQLTGEIFGDQILKDSSMKLLLVRETCL